jgi:hypothetical protein
MVDKQINPAFVSRLLGPWSGGADIDEIWEQYKHLGQFDDATFSSTVQDVLGGHFQRWDPDSQAKAKRALAYALTFASDRQLDRYFSRELPPFEPPRADYRAFWMTVWRALFGNDDWRLPGDESDYVIDDDILELNTIRYAPA